MNERLSFPRKCGAGVGVRVKHENLASNIGNLTLINLFDTKIFVLSLWPINALAQLIVLFPS